MQAVTVSFADLAWATFTVALTFAELAAATLWGQPGHQAEAL